MSIPLSPASPLMKEFKSLIKSRQTPILEQGTNQILCSRERWSGQRRRTLTLLDRNAKVDVYPQQKENFSS